MSRFANFTKRLTPEIAMIQANDNQKNSTNLQSKIHDESINRCKIVDKDELSLSERRFVVEKWYKNILTLLKNKDLKLVKFYR
jgi:hypothetical protein